MTVVRTESSVIEYCEACSKRVQMVTPTVAAEFASVSVNAVYGGIARNTLHFKETVEGRLLVCCDSLRSDCV